MKLKMDGICKSFGSNEVLKSVGFQLIYRIAIKTLRIRRTDVTP